MIEWAMLSKWQSSARPSVSLKVHHVKRSSTLSGGKVKLSLVHSFHKESFFFSGKCVYQADSSHSFLSDVRHLSKPFSSSLSVLLLTCRHINGPLFTSITHTMPRCLITTGPCLPCQMALRYADRSHSLKVPAIRSVLEYFKCAICC
jgi:hypothetical protein